MTEEVKLGGSASDFDLTKQVLVYALTEVRDWRRPDEKELQALKKQLGDIPVFQIENSGTPPRKVVIDPTTMPVFLRGPHNPDFIWFNPATRECYFHRCKAEDGITVARLDAVQVFDRVDKLFGAPKLTPKKLSPIDLKTLHCF